MKRLDLDGYITTQIERYDIKPSQLRRMEKELFCHNLCHVGQICCSSEQELLKLDGFDEDIVDLIKYILDEHGLSLGMTEEGLIAYDDAEYYARHPEKKEAEESQKMEAKAKEVLSAEEYKRDSLTDSIEHNHNEQRLDRSVNADTIFKESQEEGKTSNPPLTEDLKRRIISHYDDAVRKDMKKRLTDRAFMKITIEDVEFMRLHLFRTSLVSQPWYIRLFWPKEQRIVFAKAEADSMCEKFIDNLVTTYADRQSADLEENIESLWGENWSKYLKDLEEG